MGVQIPRVTLNADYAEESSFGDLNLCSVGYGLHQAWVYATMFGTASVFGTTNYIQGIGGSMVSLPYLVSIIVYVICLIGYGLTNQKFLHFYTERRTLLLAAALTCAGTVMLFNFPALEHNWVLEILGGILTGVGSSLLIIFWGVAFARQEGPSTVLNTAIAVSIAIIIYTVILHAVPYPGTGILAAIIPALEALILWHKTPESFLKRSEVPIFQPLPLNRGKFLVRFGLPVLIFGIALGELRQTSIQTIVPAANLEQQALMLLAAGISTVLILITVVALGSSEKWSRFFRPLVPFIIVVAFFVPLSGMTDMSMANTFLLIGFLCFEALMWIFFGELSQRFRLSPVYVYGLGRGFLAGGMMVGTLLPVLALSWVETTPLGEHSIIVLMLLVMVIAYTLLPRERDIETLVAPCPVVRVAITTQEHKDFPLEAAVAQASVASTLANGAGQTLPQEQAAKGSEGAAGAGSAGAGAADVAAAGAGSAGASSSTASASAAGAGAEASAAVTSTGKAALTAENSAALGALGTEGANQASSPVAAGSETSSPQLQAAANASPSEVGTANLSAAQDVHASVDTRATQDQNDGPRRGGGRFRGKCETVANTYLLSTRETEVLFLLAKGHNAAYIQEQLYISEGTAKTHIRHIYRKLDVHNQQELMRVVEEAEPTL